MALPNPQRPSPDLTERQAEIRRIATALFSEHGYRAVGMRAIAEAVGIRTSSLYYHFKSKEDILFSIALDITRDFVEAYVPILDGPGSATDRLADLVREHVAFFIHHRLEQRVGKNELRELAPDHGREVTHHKRVYQDRIEAFLADATEAGEFQVADPKLTAMALLDMLNGITVWYRDDGRLPIAHLADHYAAMALQLVGSHEAMRSTLRLAT